MSFVFAIIMSVAMSLNSGNMVSLEKEERYIGKPIVREWANSEEEVKAIFSEYDLVAVDREGDEFDFYFEDELTSRILSFKISGEAGEYSQVATTNLRDEEEICYTVWSDGNSWYVTAIG